jgi:hypothetical protein
VPEPVVTPSTTPVVTAPVVAPVTSTEAPVVAAKDGGATPTVVTAPVVPEKYADFKLPDGVTLAAEDLTELHTSAKDLGLSQEAAQKLVDRTVKDRAATEASVVAKQKAAVTQMATDWKGQTEADPEVGGAAIKENLATAIKARDQFATPELTKMLNESGLGNHPEVVRFFFKVGKAMSEDKFVQGRREGGCGESGRGSRGSHVSLNGSK